MATIDEQVLDGDEVGTAPSAALRAPVSGKGPEPPEGAEVIKDISHISELEKNKWRQYEHERKVGEGDHFFIVRIVWNFLPRHPWHTDVQYETYIENLDWRQIQFVKRYVYSGSRDRRASITWIVPEAPMHHCRALATKYGKIKEINQLQEYLIDLKRQYATTDDTKLTAEEIIEKYEALFRDSNDVGECIRLGDKIVSYRNLDLTKGQQRELTDADDDDLKAAQSILKKSQENDAANTDRSHNGGGFRVLAPDAEPGPEELPPEGDPAV